MFPSSTLFCLLDSTNYSCVIASKHASFFFLTFFTRLLRESFTHLKQNWTPASPSQSSFRWPQQPEEPPSQVCDCFISPSQFLLLCEKIFSVSLDSLALQNCLWAQQEQGVALFCLSCEGDITAKVRHFIIEIVAADKIHEMHSHPR